MTRLLPLVLLAACSMPTGGSWNTNEPLWQPDAVRAETGSAYAPLRNGDIAYIDADGQAFRVDLGGADAAELLPLPDGTGVATFLDQRVCEAEGDDDCASVRIDRSVAVLSQGVVQRQAQVGRHLDALAFTPDGNRAIAWLSGTVPDGDIGVVNLGEVDVIDLASGTRTPVRVGFAADTILFTDDSTRAVVLSRSQVAVVDMTSSPPVAEVTFPLTLDPDDAVRPVEVALTPDGRYAMIATEGSGDLYVLDLQDPSVNLISLPGAPSDLHVDPTTDQTLFVFQSQASLAILDHTRFDLQVLDLDEPANRIVSDADHAVLYGVNSTNLKDVYRYDYATGQLTEYRLLAAADSVQLSPDGAFAVALTQPNSSGRYGMELLDLSSDRGRSYPYGLDGRGVGVAFTQTTEGSTWAVVLQQGVDSLWRGELSTGIAETIDLQQPPLHIGDLGDGRIFIAHDEPMGLITLFDPTTNDLVESAGFALLGVFDNETEPAEATP